MSDPSSGLPTAADFPTLARFAQAEPTDPSTLHQHDGGPVPWVTRWSGEVHTEVPVLVDVRGGTTLSYDPSDARADQRDDHGVLWRREGLGRRGVPLWDEVNSHRQRMVVVKRLCHVCGRRIRTEGTTVLAREEQLHRVDGGQQGQETITLALPVCAGCLPIAVGLVDEALREDLRLLRVRDLRIWGASGRHARDLGGGAVELVAGALLRYGPEQGPVPFLAEELVLGLRSFEVAPLLPG